MTSGVPENIERHLHQFIGAELTLIGLGQHQIQFHFMSGQESTSARNPYLGVDGRWTLLDASGRVVDEQRSHWERDAYRVHALLGKVVVGVDADPPHSFSLRLTEGYRLTVSATPDGYETFSIQPGDVFG